MNSQNRPRLKSHTDSGVHTCGHDEEDDGVQKFLDWLESLSTVKGVSDERK